MGTKAKSEVQKQRKGNESQLCHSLQTLAGARPNSGAMASKRGRPTTGAKRFIGNRLVQRVQNLLVHILRHDDPGDMNRGFAKAPWLVNVSKVGGPGPKFVACKTLPRAQWQKPTASCLTEFLVSTTLAEYSLQKINARRLPQAHSLEACLRQLNQSLDLKRLAKLLHLGPF